MKTSYQIATLQTQLQQTLAGMYVYNAYLRMPREGWLSCRKMGSRICHRTNKLSKNKLNSREINSQPLSLSPGTAQIFRAAVTQFVAFGYRLALGTVAQIAFTPLTTLLRIFSAIRTYVCMYVCRCVGLFAYVVFAQQDMQRHLADLTVIRRQDGSYRQSYKTK